MKEFHDDRFGYIFEPEKFSELIDLTSAPVAGAPFMWRGQAKEEWPLHSAAYRRVSRSKEADEQGVAYYENYLLEKATHRGFRHTSGRELSDFELLARLQHHGAATRLLDTSRSMTIGLFFACDGYRDQAGALFGIHTHNLGGGEGKLLKGDYQAIIERAQSNNHPQTWEPPNISARVSAQHSQFVFSGIVDEAHGSIAIGNLQKYLIAIRIRPDLKATFLSILNETFDISRNTLFPDLDGFCSIHGTETHWSSAERW